MVSAAGETVVVAGFCRDAAPPATVAGAQATLLGRTHDAALGQRIYQVLKNLLRPRRVCEAIQGADVIVARNLEMLILAQRVKRRVGASRIVYESLDIHRTLLGNGRANETLRTLERRLLRACDLLIYSSPAFWREYFVPVQKTAVCALLVENKLLAIDGPTSQSAQVPPPGPPWRIGWFGNLRCRRTLAILHSLCDAADTKLEVIIAGKPSPAEFADFAAEINHPNIRFVGPYTVDDLPRLYGQCHFAWAIDYFEEGLNSTWLLPNRLYEAAAFGVVPIALAHVETGRWLTAHSVGLVLDETNPEAQLARTLATLDSAGYAQLRAKVEAIPDDALIAGDDDCRALVEAIAG